LTSRLRASRVLRRDGRAGIRILAGAERECSCISTSSSSRSSWPTGREFRTLLDELNAALRAKGLVPFQLWEAAFGRFNEALMVAEYDTLDAYEREHNSLHADPVCMTCGERLGRTWTASPGPICGGGHRRPPDAKANVASS
jgi:hypothetical protein